MRSYTENKKLAKFSFVLSYIIFILTEATKPVHNSWKLITQETLIPHKKKTW